MHKNPYPLTVSRGLFAQKNLNRRPFVAKPLLVLCFALHLTGCISVSLLPTPGPLEEIVLEGKGDAKVVLLDISGLISSHAHSGLIEEPSLPARIKEALTKAAEDRKVKAVVLRINTPGGTVTASDILHHEIVQFKEQRKIPVIASILDLGTSGGYYVAAAADRIVAQPSSITGSLGVIMVTLNASGLLEKVGIAPEAITSGPRKDMGSPFRPMSPEERGIFQGVIDSLYEQFVRVIQKGRPQLSEPHIRQIADGRIYSAQQAKDLGLIDSIGYLDEAIAQGKKAAKLDEARVVTYRRPGGYHHNIYSQFQSPAWSSMPAFNVESLSTLLSGGSPKFMYLWLP